ncbi:MAG TPA: LuxR C-terminal-related transcriptional regulator, partial [Ktedonobacteraceae bacterium]|nr:LuxR C-terminal-related transcriptional regulator [Ktedonobacteraceae bacterium]
IHMADPNTLVDYLLDQALSVQNERMQDFLLSTSLLNRLNGSLCDELLNQTGSQEILEILERGNPFIVRLDERQRWYGYHPFFRDALRTRLAVKYADRLPLLHLRAASWYERADQLHEATYHALAANDYYRATRLVERQSSTLLQRGEVATVQAWLEAFPLEFICLHTRLILLQAWMHVLVNRLDEAEADLQAVEELLDGTKTPEILGQIAAIRSGISVAQYDIPGSIEAARTALAQLPEDALMVRGFVSRNLGIACWLKDDVVAATQAFANAVSYNHTSSNIYAALIVSCDLANLQMVQGQLQKANTTYEQVLEYIGSADFLPVIRRARQGLGSLLYEWNELDSAEDFALAGMTFDAAGEQVQVTLNSVSIQARIKQVQGDEDEVWRLMQEGEDYIYRHHATRLVPVLSMQRARLWLMQDNIAEAGEWVVASGLSFDDALNHLREAEYLTLARVYIAQRKLVLALGLLERLRQQAEAGKRVGSLIEIAILEALAWQEQGEMQQALAALVDALVLAKPEGYIRIFVDEGTPMEALLTKALEMRSELEGLQKIAPGYIRMLLATIKQERLWRELPEEQYLLAPQIDESEEPVESLLEPLTEREIEILRLVAAGLPNRAIAEHIVVSAGTVKVHLHNIHNKLNVHNRTEAVARARDLRLLP